MAQPAAHRHVRWPVDTHDQDAAALESPSQVKEQADRTVVHPLQVVKDQQQGMLPGQGDEKPYDLLKEIGLP